MKRTILSVAYPLAPMGPDAVGGAEQILTHLDRAIVEAGHDSIVIACEGSQAAGTLIQTPWAGTDLDGEPIRRARETHWRVVQETLERHPVDLVHIHGQDFRWYMPEAEVPVLVTLHCPADWYPPLTFEFDRPHTWFNCVSESQRASFPEEPRMLDPIDNGVPVEGLYSRVRKRDFCVCFGRICPEKAFHLAVDAARRADVPLLIAGELFGYAAHKKYYDQELKPLLDERRCVIGPVGFARKRRLLTAARCLLLTSRVPETSSLVAMEALACGTPVIAFPVGALPGIVEHGKTGFLVQSPQEMAEAIPLARRLDPEDCRRAARDRFDVHRMTATYLNVYEHIVAAGPGTAPYVGVSDALTVDELNSEAQLEEIEPEWAEMYQGVEDATPFQSPDWILPWWRTLGHGELMVLTFRKKGRLKGVAPLFRYEWEAARRISILGLSITDHLDILVEPGIAQAAVRSVWRHLARIKDSWDICDFQDLPVDSPLLHQELPGDFSSRSEVCDVSPTVDLPPDYQQYLQSISSGLRRNLRRYRSQLEETGEVCFESAKPDEIDEYIGRFLDLHQARWADVNQPGMLADERVRRFHREAATRLARRGTARLHALRYNGKIAAVVYALKHGANAYGYLGGFDPALKHFSPGTLVMGYAISRAIEEGVRRWDFLRGRESYKYAWGARDRASLAFRVWPAARVPRRSRA